MPTYRLPVNLTWGASGSPGVNVWHFRTVNDLPPIGTVQDVIETIRSFYNTLATSDFGGSGLGIWRSGLTITAEEAVDVSDDTIAPVDWDPVTAQAGNNPAPPALQICVSWRTSIAARRGRGRTFLGPLGAQVLGTDGTPVDGAVTLVRTAAAAVVSASSGLNDYAIGVYGLQAAGGGPLSPRVLRDVTGATVTDQFAILRSRRD